MSALPAATRQKLAACRARGLHYWCDSHEPAAVWAVDDTQQARFVALDPAGDANTTQTHCGSADHASGPDCSSTLPLFDVDDLTPLVSTI